jgi:WD40 repeat protein
VVIPPDFCSNPFFYLYFRIYNLETFVQEYVLETHHCEILTIAFSETNQFMASAGRDRLIHIYNLENNFQLVQTLDDHSSSILSLKFCNGHDHLVSSAADKSLHMRVFKPVRYTVFVMIGNSSIWKSTSFSWENNICRYGL